MHVEFLEAVAVAFRNAGTDAKFDGLYLVVGGCKFGAESKKSKRGPHYRVKFLRSSFKVVEADGVPLFDVSKAVGLVVAELPARLKEKEQQRLLVERVVACRKLAGHGATVTDLFRTWYPVADGVYASATAEAYEVKVVGPDLDELLRRVGNV